MSQFAPTRLADKLACNFMHTSSGTRRSTRRRRIVGSKRHVRRHVDAPSIVRQILRKFCCRFAPPSSSFSFTSSPSPLPIPRKSAREFRREDGTELRSWRELCVDPRRRGNPRPSWRSFEIVAAGSIGNCNKICAMGYDAAEINMSMIPMVAAFARTNEPSVCILTVDH